MHENDALKQGRSAAPRVHEFADGADNGTPGEHSLRSWRLARYQEPEIRRASLEQVRDACGSYVPVNAAGCQNLSNCGWNVCMVVVPSNSQIGFRGPGTFRGVFVKLVCARTLCGETDHFLDAMQVDFLANALDPPDDKNVKAVRVTR